MGGSRNYCRNCGKPYPTEAQRDAPPDESADAGFCWDDDEADCSGDDAADGWDRVDELRIMCDRLAAENARLRAEAERARRGWDDED